MKWLIKFLYPFFRREKWHEGVRLLESLSSIKKGKGFIPPEFFPMGLKLYSRGLLNSLMIPLLNSFYLPYFWRMQLDPTHEGWTVRGFNPFFLNTAFRNWTGIGLPGLDHEGIVDPRGMLTHPIGMWSLDICLYKVEEDGSVSTLHPASLKDDDYIQRIRHGVSMVEGSFFFSGAAVTTSVWMEEIDSIAFLIYRVKIKNELNDLFFSFSIRPFNPEGITPIMKIFMDGDMIRVDGDFAVYLRPAPEFVISSNLEMGDSLERLGKFLGKCTDMGFEKSDSCSCDNGIANLTAGYRVSFSKGEFEAIALIRVDREKGGNFYRPSLSTAPSEPSDRFERIWNDYMDRIPSLDIKDERINLAYRASIVHLLVLLDSNFICPGPLTYHDYWLRDSAYMLSALLKLRLYEEARGLIKYLPSFKRRKGFFGTQSLEWDGTGQALWMAGQYLRETGDKGTIESVYSCLRSGALWIMRTRRGKGSFNGILPAGYSAEHLGPPDFYFWDNFWCLAGLREMAFMAGEFKKEKDEERFSLEFERFRRDLFDVIESSTVDFDGFKVLPASPTRRPDWGMIGNICPLYPLGLIEPDTDWFRGTVEAILQNFFHRGGFLHGIVHSGINPYLSLQVAEALLSMGDRDRAIDILTKILSFATSTWTFPEAIHPITGGGCMGDGHHGWSAAEVIILLCNLYGRNRIT